MPIPCVQANHAGLALFQATADQRFLLGAEAFLQTHTPVRFWRHQAGRQTVWTEEDLLTHLRRPTAGLRGNRVFILYGAAGSGKSEVMRWLLTRLEQANPDRARYALRVSRTDLDPVRIIQRALETFTAPGLGESLLQRWEEVRRKPVALANQMVWHALAGLFDADEEILPLSYRLRPVIEANLRNWFAHLQDTTGSGSERPLHFLSREQLAQVMGETVLDLDLAYEHLRARLQDGFEQYALAGLRVVPTLRRISQHLVEAQGVRPLLIVDDLVQSMNVFASDLLDYLLTLEEGEWDVVLGLTPAAFEWDGRGRELLSRLRELDTVDDRVTRLDLSDTTGDASAFLDEERLADFLTPYLAAYKASAGFTCGHSCPHSANCTALQWGQVPGPDLAPFNPALLRRLWRSLPMGKGRARYLLLAVREALEGMVVQGQAALPALAKQVARDLYVAHPDPRLRDLIACYHPGATQAPAEPLPLPLAEAWGLKWDAQIQVQPLTSGDPFTAQPAGLAAPSDPNQEGSPGIPTVTSPDPVRVALSTWLEGGAPHHELLRPFRQGLARVVTEVVDPTLLLGVGHAQVRGALRWSAQQDGAMLPIHLQGEESGGGLFVPRTIGTAAFLLLDYQAAKGPGRTAVLERLLQDPTVIALFLEAEALRARWRTEVSGGLTMKPEAWAFHLYRTALALGAPLPVPDMLRAEQPPAERPHAAWKRELLHAIRSLWEDAFRLRDHLYDGDRLHRYLTRWPGAADSLHNLMAIPTESLPATFRVCGERLATVMNVFAQVVEQLEAERAKTAPAWPERCFLVKGALALADGRSRAALERRISQIRQGGESQDAHVLAALPLPPAVPLQERLAAILVGPVSGDVAAAYHQEAAWGALTADPWFQAVCRWWQGWQRVWGRLHTGLSPEGSPPSPVTPVALFVAITHLQSQAEGARRQQATLDEVSALLTSPYWQEQRRTVHLLALLLPDGVRVHPDLISLQAQVRGLLEEIRALESWQRQGQAIKSPPHYHSPSPESARTLLRGLSAAVAWWQSQIALLAAVPATGRPPALDRARQLLVAAEQLEEPARDLVVAWSRFLSVAADLPRRISRCRRLSPSAQALLQAFLQEEHHAGGGPTLGDLTPDLLQEVRTLLPDLTNQIRLSIDLGAPTDGVLYRLDRQ